MAISARLKALLDGAKVKYTAARHAVVYTAQEIAAAQHVSGRSLAKCVLVNTNHGPMLAVLPASCLIDFKQLKAALGATSLSIAKESDIKAAFPDVEVGAMSPFGNLYGVPVVVDKLLGESEDVVFNAGSHTDTIKMRYRDVVALAKPKMGAFGQPFGGPKKKVGTKSKKKSGSPKKAKSARRPAQKKSSRRR